MRILKQAIYEFGLPLAVAVFWVTYRVVFPGSLEFLSDIITYFAAAFFFSSWAVGQLMRIKHKQKVDDNFLLLRTQLVELTSTLSVVNQELQEQAKDNPQLQPVIDDIASLTLSTNNSVALANTALSQASGRAPNADLGSGRSTSFDSEYAGRWEVWKALLDRSENPRELLDLGHKWLAGTEDQPEWPFIWQTLLDYDADKSDLLARGRAWLSDREDRLEWSYIWRNLISYDFDRRDIAALGRRWLIGREDRADWAYVWRKVLDLDPDRASLVDIGRRWLVGREGRPGGRIVAQKIAASQ